MMLEDNEMENENNDSERVINKLIKDVSDGYDIDVCSNAFWINKDGKACIFIKNVEGITNKTTKINNVIPQSFYISYMYSIENMDIDIDIAGYLYKRLLKYISRGFRIINDTDNYITKSIDISRILKNYPLDKFYEQTTTCLQLYRCLPSVICSESDINILNEISNGLASLPDINVFDVFGELNNTHNCIGTLPIIQNKDKNNYSSIKQKQYKHNNSIKQKELKVDSVPDIYDLKLFPTLKYSHTLYLSRNK